MMVWRNGKLVSADGAVDARDRGVMLGDGVFETMVFQRAGVLRLDRHLNRLRRGLQVLGMTADVDAADVEQGAAALADVTDVVEGALRLTVLRGPGARGVLPTDMGEPTVLMALTPVKLCDDTPLKLIIAQGTRRNDLSPMSTIKSTNYGDAILARMEADNVGADDALILNTRGTLAEATAANVFCLINGTLVTPPASDGALPGVMRDIVLAHEDVEEMSISEASLSDAQEIFLTSSIGIRPVIAINQNPVGDGQPGAIARRLVNLPRTAV